MNDATGPKQAPCTRPAEGGAAPPGGLVGHLVTRVARLHRTAAGRALRESGLYPGQEIVLGHLWEAGGPVRQSDLIKAVELDPSTVTKTLQRLEQSGHVTRAPDPADRRAVLVEATELSCALSRQVESVWAGLEEHALAGLTPADRAELARLLAAMEANLCDRAGGCSQAEAE
ncbi:MarR family winged helix-turn-helix transcriptional regulator [Streptomyces koyangensis]|uniref:MarR family winged helix-turn-helix transcriptional regulator n=1 Tax=Streptomyces koyangensis TaxID=188770 RepID=UPI003456A2C7